MAEPESIDRDDLIRQFCELTAASPADAQRSLDLNAWNLDGAVSEYYTAQEEGIVGAQESNENAPEAEPEPYTGPRTLDGRPAPQAIPSVGSSSAPPTRRPGGVATLDSLNRDPHAGHSHGPGHSHDDDDDDESGDYTDEDIGMTDEEPRDLFAGGEKSALAVQDPSKKSKNDPKKVVDDILKKARVNAKRSAGGEPSASQASRFRGSGMTLGGDDHPSQVIPDPHPRAAPSVETQTRILHLWEDGFSIEDGPLRRFDDPANAADLNTIRNGRAPLHLMGVRPEQPVDVQLQKHDEPYKTRPKVYKPFGGSGHRLGSPTPGGSNTVTAPEPAATPAASSTPSIPTPEIDSSAPTLSLRLQLANGTRLPARFNTTQTVGDVYNFIDQASPSAGRDWVLATTFPTKNHTDKALVLGEMDEFKRGGTAVQKWT